MKTSTLAKTAALSLAAILWIFLMVLATGCVSIPEHLLRPETRARNRPRSLLQQTNAVKRT